MFHIFLYINQISYLYIKIGFSSGKNKEIKEIIRNCSLRSLSPTTEMYKMINITKN